MNSNFNVKKFLTISIASLLILSIAASITQLPTASAHTPAIQVPTYAYINVAPQPIGIGQQITIVFWLDKVPIGAEGLYGDRWHGYTVTVTKPDGTTESLGPFSSDVNGGASTRYTPNQVGTYTFLFKFPGQVAQNANPYPYTPGFVPLGLDYVNDTFLPSSATT
ncbi:MAG TPA: hypothetical protein VLU95_03645, partial [Candidatus Acidoferrum sp.]|nr:hypothetical protein [Candidatus Acidoferrum sp.]